ncbi:MAG TPA: SDR family oxidoreductase [Saprospiraceae bacterium]|nr:SDR family oxidoreductase [Saprospiraceae bacterium]
MSNFVVVGGSSGIGKEVVNKLLSGGHYVVNISRTPSNIVGVKDITMDILKDEYDSAVLPEVVDGLVYCPGSITLKGFKSIKEEQFVSDFQINVLGAIKSIKACLPKMNGPQKGSIVLFSTVAVQLGMPFHASVAASKGAIEGLTRSLAAEFAPKLRVNAIAPSLTDTPLAFGLLNTDEKKQRSSEMHPLKRIGSSEDIANAVTFLLSDNSSWITGQILGVDGGLSQLKV